MINHFYVSAWHFQAMLLNLGLVSTWAPLLVKRVSVKCNVVNVVRLEDILVCPLHFEAVVLWIIEDTMIQRKLNSRNSFVFQNATLHPHFFLEAI